jgi:predicted transcriptional regulator
MSSLYSQERYYKLKAKIADLETNIEMLAREEVDLYRYRRLKESKSNMKKNAREKKNSIMSVKNQNIPKNFKIC